MLDTRIFSWVDGRLVCESGLLSKSDPVKSVLLLRMGPREDLAGVLAELCSTQTWPGYGVYLLQNGKSRTFEVGTLSLFSL